VSDQPKTEQRQAVSPIERVMKKTKIKNTSHKSLCEDAASRCKELHDAFMSKGFTSDQSFKLLCLVIPNTNYYEPSSQLDSSMFNTWADAPAGR